MEDGTRLQPGTEHPPAEKPHPGRICRLAPDDEKKLFELIRMHRNPMLGWIAEIALETSMREGEIVKIRTSQANLKWRIIAA
jgi:hypothetical protein